MTDVQILDISNAKYHAMDGVWSSSQLKLLPGDPMLFDVQHIAKTMPFKRTKAMELGTKVHRLLLDGAETIDIPPEVLSKVGSTNTNAYRRWEIDVFLSNPTDRPVPVKSDDPIKHIIANLRAHKMVRELLSASVFREQSIVWTDRDTGLKLRSRADDVAYFPNADQPRKLWDLKTCSSIEERDKQSQMLALKYHRSLDHYGTGLAVAGGSSLLSWDGSIDEVLIVWAETSEPYRVHVQAVAERALSRAAEQNWAAKEDLARRLVLHAAGDPDAWLPDDYHLPRPELDLPEYEYQKEVT